MARTGNGDWAYDNTENALVEFFSKAGSLFKNKMEFYGNEQTALQLFKGAWGTDRYKAMQLAMWLRDCRGGSGNRSGFRDVIRWVAEKDSDWVEANMHFIPEVGRWDDLQALIGTSCEDDAMSFWVRAIQDGNGLAAKWAPRAKRNKEVFNKLRRTAKMSPKDFRKLLVNNTKVVETSMCNQDFQDIEYSKVPSVAMSRYNNAFKKHDGARFSDWKNKLETGEEKVNASVLFPHDVFRTLMADLKGGYNGGWGHYGNRSYEDSKLANAQFEALPDYMEGADMRIMSICDFSGSMDWAKVSGSITALHVSLSLGLYCSDRLGKENPFYRKFIPFSDDSSLVCWKDETFSVAAQAHNDGFCGSTNIKAALNQILDAGRLLGATDNQMPNCLLILSDMQFYEGTVDGETTVETGMKEWEAAGYTRPRIVYWNLAGNRNSPATVHHKDVALVSGFSPSLLKAILGGDDFTPMGILERAIEKYRVIDPATGEPKV